MPHMNLEVKAVRYTTREGNHPDDEAYLEQVKGMLELRLSELHFIRPEIKIEWTE